MFRKIFHLRRRIFEHYHRMLGKQPKSVVESPGRHLFCWFYSNAFEIYQILVSFFIQILKEEHFSSDCHRVAKTGNENMYQTLQKSSISKIAKVRVSTSCPLPKLKKNHTKPSLYYRLSKKTEILVFE